MQRSAWCWPHALVDTLSEWRRDCMLKRDQAASGSCDSSCNVGNKIIGDKNEGVSVKRTTENDRTPYISSSSRIQFQVNLKSRGQRKRGTDGGTPHWRSGPSGWCTNLNDPILRKRWTSAGTSTRVWRASSL